MIIKYQLIITKLAFVRLNNYLARKTAKSKLKPQEIQFVKISIKLAQCLFGINEIGLRVVVTLKSNFMYF